MGTITGKKALVVSKITSRSSTGLPGLDGKLDGGIPADSTIILESEPNNFTYYFQQQFLNVALSEKKPGIYICVERSPDKVMESMEIQGMDVKKYIDDLLLLFIDFSRVGKEKIDIWKKKEIIPKVNEGIITLKNLNDKDDIKIALDVALEYLGNAKGMRIVVESTPYILPEDSAVSTAMFWGDAMKTFSSCNPTVLYSFPSGFRDDLLAVMNGKSDGVISMAAVEVKDAMRVKLNVKKMLYTPKLPRNLIVIEEQEGKINAVYYEMIT